MRPGGTAARDAPRETSTAKSQGVRGSPGASYLADAKAAAAAPLDRAAAGTPVRLLVMPLIMLNLGAEMVYILDQRLRAKPVAPEIQIQIQIQNILVTQVKPATSC